MINLSAKLFAGTSGLVLPVKNKQFYPPDFRDKSRLSYYASLYNSIEINSSFYKVPMASTVRKWAAEVPGDFRFTFKLWREITHNKGLLFKREDVFDFMKVISEAGAKSGAMLVQFPPGTKAGNIGQLETLLDTINEADPGAQWKVAIEFRDRSWYQDDVYDLLQEHGGALVIHDMPLSRTPHRALTEGFAYLRFHGPDGNYRGSYGQDLLVEYASTIREWMQEGNTVYTYFNNTMGEATRNLTDLRHAVSGLE